MALLGTGIWLCESLAASDRVMSAPLVHTSQQPGPRTWSRDALVASDGVLSAPVGYTAQQMIFDDQFSGTSLDTTKWNTFMGAQGIVWNNNGNLPPPYSGPNVPGDGSEAMMFGPSQVAVNNGLTLTAQRNTNAYTGSYPWISGVVTTGGKFDLPAGGWYVQVKAKMPDQSQGMWPGIWFLPGVAGTAANELDGYEGGMTGSSPPNQQGHCVYFTDQGVQLGRLWNTGADVSAGYHVYGVQFVAGHSITAYFDGRPVWQVDASSSAPLTAEPYEIILSLQVATEHTSTWHTVTTAATPSETMDVAEVQAYSYP
jgi:beta-glucanase (GH16 family)